MKVVINVCHGGFGLSNKAVKRCIELGMKETVYNTAGNYIDESADFVKAKLLTGKNAFEYHIKNAYENEFRMNPIVVQVVEELGKKADGTFSKLKIVDIPFETADGWHVDEYDGYESICENHRSWS
jgi:hypothetical protein